MAYPILCCRPFRLPIRSWGITTYQYYYTKIRIFEAKYYIVSIPAWTQHLREGNDIRRYAYPVEFCSIDTTCRSSWHPGTGYRQLSGTYTAEDVR